VKYCRYIGLDYGEKTIGVAVTVNGRVATGVKTLRRKNAVEIRACLKELKEIIREYEINKIVLGFPKNLNGDDSARCAETLAFKEKLARYFKKEIILWDERLSTRAVTRTFNGNRVNYKKNVDTMAAVYILQGYLDYKNNGGDIMLDENFNAPEDDDEGDSLVIIDENGDECPLQILSSREENGVIYLLAIEEEAGEVYHFKCEPGNGEDDDDDDVMLEQIDAEHDDYKRVFEMFKDDYEELGIEFEEDIE
jgi:putative Holliday junction resolvase